HDPHCFGGADDCQVEIVDLFAPFARFHEQIAHASVDNRLDEYVILSALDDETAAARSRVVKVSANYFLDRICKRNSSRERLRSLNQPNLIRPERNRRNGRLPIRADYCQCHQQARSDRRHNKSHSRFPPGNTLRASKCVTRARLRYSLEFQGATEREGRTDGTFSVRYFDRDLEVYQGFRPYYCPSPW